MAIDDELDLLRPQVGTRNSRYRGRVLEVVEDALTFPNGRQSVHTTVIHPGAVVVIPQDKDGAILVLRQYRHSLGEFILELPAGTLEVGEDPRACAEREIVEETGMRAESWVPLGSVWPAPGFCNEVQHLFLARDLSSAVASCDEDEILRVVRLSVREFEEGISSGAISDSKSIAAFARARLRSLV